MWIFLDFIARLIALGGLALAVGFVWRIVSAEDTAQRVCVCCGVTLYALELATCSDCLGGNYDCACGWVESDEWYAPYPLHDDQCPIQIRLVEAVPNA
jgi:hypothetical protein